VFIGEGALQTLGGPAHVSDALNGVTQVIPRGPVASQEVIKQLGTNALLLVVAVVAASRRDARRPGRTRARLAGTRHRGGLNGPESDARHVPLPGCGNYSKRPDHALDIDP